MAEGFNADTEKPLPSRYLGTPSSERDVFEPALVITIPTTTTSNRTYPEVITATDVSLDYSQWARAIQLTRRWRTVISATFTDGSGEAVAGQPTS